MSVFRELWPNHELVVQNYLSGGELKISAEDKEKINQAKNIFQSLINPEFKGIDYLKEIHLVLDKKEDEINAEHDIKCKARYSLCCHQIINCSYLEMMYIVEHIKMMPKSNQKKILKSFQKSIRKMKIHSFLKSNQAMLNGKAQKLIVKFESKFFGTPCIFLNKLNNCSIYDFRPIVCRTHRSTYNCSQNKNIHELYENNSLKYSIFLYRDEAAHYLMSLEEERIIKKYNEYPFIIWSFQKPFINFFQKK